MICRNCKQNMFQTSLNGGGYWRCSKCNEVAVYVKEDKPKSK